MEIDAVISLPMNSKKMNFPYRNNASSLMHVSAVSSAVFSHGTLVCVIFVYERLIPLANFVSPFFL